MLFTIGKFSVSYMSKEASVDEIFAELDTNNDGKFEINEIDPDMDAYVSLMRDKIEIGNG